MVTENKSVLSTKTCEAIDHWVQKYPEDQKQSAVIPALHLAQEQNGGYLTEELMDAVADYLSMTKISVYEVGTFYSMYELNPVGKHKINVCTNLSCMLAGSDEVVAHLQKKLTVKFGETTLDGKFTLKEAECLGACVGAPMMQVDRDYHEHLTPEKIDKILDDIE